MLKGSMYITNNINDINLFNSVIIDMDEEDSIKIKNPNIIKGTLLLPPPQAMIAEADGNERLYDEIYSNYLLSPKIKFFIGSLIACLYKGMQVIFYIPSDFNNTILKFSHHLFGLYGIHPGIVGAKIPEISNWYFKDSFIPMWLCMLYMNNVISPHDYLYLYPIELIIPEDVMGKLINDINPYGTNINSMINYIASLHRDIKFYRNIESPISVMKVIEGEQIK